MTSTPIGYPVIPLRPLSLGELFQSSFTIYRARFAQFLLLGLIPTAVGLAILLAMAALLVTMTLPLLINGARGLQGVSVLAAIGLGVLLFASIFISAAADYTATGLIGLGVVAVNRGEQPTASSLWRQARGLPAHALALTLIYVGVGFLVGLGLLPIIFLAVDNEAAWLILPLVAFLIAFGIVVQARLGLVLQVLAIEGTGAVESIKRCWRLTEGHAARVFGSILLASVLTGMVAQTFSGLMQALITPFIEQSMKSGSGYGEAVGLTLVLPIVLGMMVMSQVVSAVISPFMGIFTGVLYIDTRRRQEAASQRPVFV